MRATVFSLLLGLGLLPLRGWSQTAFTPLVPAMRPAPSQPATTVPDYGELLDNVRKGLDQLADIPCRAAVNQELATRLNEARSNVSAKTTYVVIADITTKTNCRVTTFRPVRPGEKPTVIHDPAQKLLFYTLDVYPWMTINGRRY